MYPIKTEEAYIPKHNDKRNNQVNLLMITDGTSNWHYLAVKSISGLPRGVIIHQIIVMTFIV